LIEEIDAARTHNDIRQEARGWDYLGDLRLKAGQFERAESDFSEAFRLRKLFFPADLPYSFARIGKLRLAQNRLEESSRFTELAIAAGARIETVFPRFSLIHQRGKIAAARGDFATALSEFESAVELATKWREETLPAIPSLTSVNAALEEDVFDSLIETAALLGQERKALESVERNRAVSLKQTLGLASVWRNRLPTRYWDVLGEFRRASSEKSKAELTEMEAEAGLRNFTKKPENFLTRKLLIDFRQVLSTTDLFLSFHLGKTASYLWAVTAGSLRMYRLGPADEIHASALRFRDAVRDGAEEAEALGEKLYAELFGELRWEESAKRDWIISADDALYEVPLAALVTERKAKLKYLIEEHSLRLVPGAWSLAKDRPAEASSRPAAGWLGVGDPIYNRADARWTAPHPFMNWVVNASTVRQFTRLAASGEEVRESARSWGPGAVVLEGPEATRERFQIEAENHPAAIHLATHVVTQPDRPADARIAFGIDMSGEPQYLTAADIAMMQVPGAVVAMTGCTTGGGEIRRGAGLIGLTRAWQTAGARTVIGTLWPMDDTPGDLFAKFYASLPKETPAAALRNAQLAMIRSGGWRSRPQYWSSYQLTGGTQ
jgi:CHAT domain-containing protein